MNESHVMILHRSKVFRSLSEEAFEQMCSETEPKVKSFDKGEEVVNEGDKENSFGIVVEGMLQSEKFHEAGYLHIVSQFEQGDIVSLESVSTSKRLAPITIAAARKSEVVYFSIDRIRECTYRDELIKNIIEILADENIKKLHKIDILSRSGLRERIVTYLNTVASKTDSKTFNIRMTQEQFAQYLAVNRSALSNELNKMRREGLIEFKKDRFTIL